jgi:hypothetical protein
MQTKPSNRMSHGLASRAVANARAHEAAKLAKFLLRDLPKAPEVEDAALALAESMLQLNAARYARRAFLSGPPNDSGTNGSPVDNCQAPPDTRADQAFEGMKMSIDEDQPICREIATTLKILQRDPWTYGRLEDYERKAFSRRNRLLIRLDYLVIEARRREAARPATD